MLPIFAIREAILQELRKKDRLVLSAPTGSGKTTQVPQFLLQSGAVAGEIMVLQPRRLAARLMAERVAREVGCAVGTVVGYQTRHDSRIGPDTRIRFVTEGLFLRLLQSDASLAGVGAVILDEFHERNLPGDVAMALLKKLQETRRPDLKLLVMSATLDVQRTSAYLDCQALEAHGRLYPVEIRYVAGKSTAGRKTTQRWEQRGPTPPWELAASSLASLLREQPEGDVLIFMPGAHEIRRTIEACERLGEDLEILPLYSELSAAEQDRALAPASRRKVIVSTNVAETSITIEGIRHVIDSGLARIHRFDPRRAINVLGVEPISQASADQRAGRAGRVAPGTATRLWGEQEHRHRPAHSTPEVRRLDLAEVLLQLHAMGIGDVKHFDWLEPPDSAAVTQAEQTLAMLGALDGQKLTPLGRAMAELPMHPRLSRMLLEARKRGCGRRGALWAALISERDIVPDGVSRLAEDLPDAFPRSDFLLLERAMQFASQARFDVGRCAAMGINALAAREVDRARRQYERASGQVGGRDADGGLAGVVKALLVGFSDHLAVRRNAGVRGNLACLLTGGRRGQLDPDSLAREAELILPLEVRELTARGEARTVLSLATEIDPQWVRELFSDRITTDRQTRFDAQTQTVESVQREVLCDLPLAQTPVEPQRHDAARLLADEIMAGRLRLLHWDEKVDQWIERVRCVCDWFPERRLIRYEDDELRLILEELCAGATRWTQVKDRPVLPAFRDALSWADQQFVEQMAPERLQLPRGWRMKIDYRAGTQPRGRARIQDFYGLTQTPAIAAGRVKLLLEILAPSNRPVQLTEDLAGFWEKLYPTLKKDLARRYPKHEWR